MTSDDGEARAVAVADEDVQATVVAIIEAGQDADPELLASLAGSYPARALVAGALSLGSDVRENPQAMRLLCLSATM